jgi:hypothetical protein
VTKIRYTATQIVGMLREAESLLGTGKSVGRDDGEKASRAEAKR